MIGACQKSALWWQIRKMILDQVCVAKTLLNSWSCWGTVEMAHQVFSGKIGQAVEARMRTRAMQRSKCTIVLKVFATRTAWDFHNVIPTDHRSFLKCNVLLGMSIKDIVKMCMHNNNYSRISYRNGWNTASLQFWKSETSRDNQKIISTSFEHLKKWINFQN